MTRRWATLLAAVLLVALCVPLAGQPFVIDEVRARAQTGDAEAQLALGRAYAIGLGVPEDDAEAARWFRLAADQGFAGAQFRLGLSYAHGITQLQDDAQAVRWYRLAADQGHPEAQFNLGLM